MVTLATPTSSRISCFNKATSADVSNRGRPPAFESSPSHAGSARALARTAEIARRLATPPSFFGT
eukprot:138479-Lingulodinium_polyedra.AAC.1